MTRLAGLGIDRRAWLVTRVRVAVGGYVNGKYVPGAPSSEDIRAVVQPISGNELKDMPEGIRTEARNVVWSRSEIKVDDEITDAGVKYRVLFVWPRNRDGEFYRAAMGKTT